MTGQADLSGCRLLIVEDDYFLASETKWALEDAGADVLGPCPSEELALAEIAQAVPTGAFVDINFGDGPSYCLARVLRERGVPFVFLTGYDERMIPDEFADVKRLVKPVASRHLLSAAADMVGA